MTSHRDKKTACCRSLLTTVPALSLGVLFFPASPARGDMTGYEVDYSLSMPGLTVARIYLHFESPENRLLLVGDAFGDAMGPLGFYHHPFGTDRAPTPGAIAADPLAELDTFITMKLAVSTPEDGTVVAPDFDSVVFNTAGMLRGTWFNNPPDNGQSNPDKNNRYLIAQITTFEGEEPGFTLSADLYWQNAPNEPVTATPMSISMPIELQYAQSIEDETAGSSTTLEYGIRNHFDHPVQFGLDAALSLGGIGPWTADPTGAKTVTIGPNAMQTFVRTFTVPDLGPIAGPYMQIYAARNVVPGGAWGLPYRVIHEEEPAHWVMRPRFGATILTHGQDDVAEVEALAIAMMRRVNNGTVLRFFPATAHWDFVAGSLMPNEELFLLLSWPEMYTGMNTIDRVNAAAEAMAVALREIPLPGTLGSVHPLSSGIHFIGHSRGCSVNSEILRRFALDGITVDHVTTINPVAWDGTGSLPNHGDPLPRVWTNNGWADNYRASGSSSTNLPMAGAFNTLVNNSESTVLEWYAGTFDLWDFVGSRALTYGPDLGLNVGGYWSELLGGPDVSPRPAVLNAPIDPLDPIAGPAPRTMVNGDFQAGMHQASGWEGHGGVMVVNATMQEGSNTFIRMNALTFQPAIRHNRFWIRSTDATFRLSYRVQTPGSDDRLRVFMTDLNGNVHELFDIGFNLPLPELETRFPQPDVHVTEIEPSEPQWMTKEVFIPAHLRNRGYTLTAAMQIVGTPELLLDLDNFEFLPGPAGSIGDINGDGLVSSADLGILLGSWGSPGCGGVSPCAADLNGDGNVGPADLGILLGNWP